jgi:hypothetical protein
MGQVDPMGIVLVAFVVALVIAALFGVGADSRDGFDGAGVFGRRHHQRWTWW